MVCKWRFLVAHDSDCQGLAVARLGFGLPNRIATSDSNSIGWIGLARWFSAVFGSQAGLFDLVLELLDEKRIEGGTYPV